jgi:hypothetical protein
MSHKSTPITDLIVVHPVQDPPGAPRRQRGPHRHPPVPRPHLRGPDPSAHSVCRTKSYAFVQEFVVRPAASVGRPGELIPQHYSVCRTKSLNAQTTGVKASGEPQSRPIPALIGVPHALHTSLHQFIWDRHQPLILIPADRARLGVPHALAGSPRSGRRPPGPPPESTRTRMPVAVTVSRH